MAIATERQALGYLGAVVLAATAIRLVLGFVYFGFHTGDDVEILQEGFLRALGWPYEPWVIRNRFVSDVLAAPVVALAHALGVGSTRTLVWLATWPFVALASLNVCLVYGLVKRWLESREAALVAAGLYAFHWLPLGYGSTVYPRTASTACVLLAAWLLVREPRQIWRALSAGGLVGVAWAIRYSEVVFLAPLCTALWLGRAPVRRRVWESVALVAGFLAASVVTIGIEDWLTWGRPFTSLIAFARYTLVERESSSLEVAQPWYWFLWRLTNWLPLTLLPLLWNARRVPGALAVALYAALPLVAFSFIHQKQLRYLQGIIPFVIALVAAGAWSLWRDGKRGLAIGSAVLSLLWGIGGLTFLQKKSMAAVTAAREIASLPPAQGSLCLSQLWAYGGALYVGSERSVVELPYPLRAEALEGQLAGCSIVALYREDYRRDQALSSLLAASRFTPLRDFEWGRSKPVVVLRRAPG